MSRAGAPVKWYSLAVKSVSNVTPTKLITDAEWAGLKDKVPVLMAIDSEGTVAIGGPDEAGTAMTYARGIRYGAGEKAIFEIGGPNGLFYAMATGGSVNVRVMVGCEG